MQTHIASFVKLRPEHQELDNILRSCVHCGFCNATCPTYQLTGNELDGPRGRIYLLKQMLEGQPVSSLSQDHLDRCLSCRSCETTCPSGVRYVRLYDLGLEIMAEKIPRAWADKIKRALILLVFPYRTRFQGVMFLARWLKPLLPDSLSKKIPKQTLAPPWPQAKHKRKVLILQGCVQTPLQPQIDQKLACVLDQLGISLLTVQSSGCCGALNYHLQDRQQAQAFARQNIDACWPYIEQGIESIVSTASGCGLMLKEYGELLQYDASYAEKAMRMAALCQDASELLQSLDISAFCKPRQKKIAFQSPCTLQHGLGLDGMVESLLTRLGYELVPIKESHLCCGSAGVYSLLQAELSTQLRDNKLASLQLPGVELIATANIGCLSHLQAASAVPVIHWLELI